MAKHETSWILELVDHISGPAKKVMASVSGVTGTAKQMSQKFGELGAKGNEMFSKLGAGFGKMREYASEVPILGQALELLSNPIALVGSLAVGIGVLASNVAQANDEIIRSQLLVQASFDDTGESLNQLNANFVATSRVFERDTTEMVSATNALKNEYADLGLTSHDALELIQQGLVATGNKLELRQVEEYSAQMRAVGLDARETIGFIAASQRMGIFDDKGIDAVKEFGLRLREMAPAADEALRGIGLSSDALMQSLNDGSKTTFDVLQEVSAALASADVQAQQTAIADLFGGPGEDAGIRFLSNIKDMNIELDSMIDKSNPLIAMQMERLELEEKLAAQQQAVAPFVAEMQQKFEEIKLSIQSMFYSAFQWVLDHGTEIKAVLIGISVVLGGMAIGWLAVNGAALAAATAMGVFKVAFMLFNAVLAVTPLGWILIAVGALAGAVYWAWNEFAEFRGVVMGVWEVMKTFGNMLYDTVIVRLKGILSGITGIGSALMKLFTGDFAGAWEAGKTAVGDLTGLNQIDEMTAIYKDAGGQAAVAFANGYGDGVNSFNADNPTSAGEAANDPLVDPIAQQGLNLSGGQASGTSTEQSKSGIEGGGGNKVVTMTIGDIVMNFSLPTGLQQGAEDAANTVAKVLTDKLRNGLVLGS